MPSVLQVIDPLVYPEWDKLLLSSRGSSFFHSSMWARALCDSYQYLPCYLAKIRDNKITSLLPFMEIDSFLTGKRGVSLPFTDYCEPIISDSSDLNEMMDFMIDHAKNRKWKYIEYRGGADIMGAEFSLTSHYRHVVQLSSDCNAVFSQFKSSTQRNIRKAEREGVTVSLGSSVADIEVFYHLHCLTRKRHGLPPQPFTFFRNIHEHILSKDHGQVVLAHYQGRTIAGALYLHFGHEAIYKFGASMSGYLHLRPNDLIMWAAIQEYCRKGFEQFCFGRTEPQNEGLRHFKSGWGAKEMLIHYYRYDLNKKAFAKDQDANPGISKVFFRSIPLFVSRWLGTVLYRHVG